MADVRFARAIYRPTFPVAWDEEKYDAPKKKQDEKQPPPGNAYSPTNRGSTFRQGETQLQMRQGDYSHMHPKLKAFFEPIMKKFDGKFRINEIIKAAGIAWRDVPKFAPDKMTGRELLCWDHVCGICKFGKNCERIQYHVPGDKLPDKFVDDTISVLMPGVQKMQRDDYDRKEYQQAGAGSYYGRDPKRARGGY
jgi:hypothetical protein